MAFQTDWRQILNGTDIHTIRLIVRLQAEDASTLAATAEGDTDAHLAVRLLKDDLIALENDIPYCHHDEPFAGAQQS